MDDTPPGKHALTDALPVQPTASTSTSSGGRAHDTIKVGDEVTARFGAQQYVGKVTKIETKAPDHVVYTVQINGIEVACLAQHLTKGAHAGPMGGEPMDVDSSESAKFSAGHITPGAHQKVLLLGEGDFSFAASLAKNLPAKGSGVVATSYDSAQEVNEKYGNAPANITATRQAGATVVHSVDAQHIDPNLGGPPPEFQYIVFNFPFVPGPRAAAKQRNKTMLENFLLSARAALAPGGKIYVTSKPYWLARFDLTESAQAANLNCETPLSFDPSEFPGYEHRMSHEDTAAGSTDKATTCVFSKAAS